MTEAEVKIIRTSTEGIMATDMDRTVEGISANRTRVGTLFSAYTPKKLKLQWIEKNPELWVCPKWNRVFVYVQSTGGNYYWMDAVTGTLYNLDGQCMSGFIYLDIPGLIPDKAKAKEILLSIDVFSAH